MTIDLRLGDYRTALADVGEVDAVITDPPYGERTHSGQRHGRKAYDKNTTQPIVSARGLGYSHWTPEDVAEFIARWSPICRGWFVALTSDDLVPAWKRELAAAGRYVFHPLPCVMIGMNVRLAGDGPSSWCVWAIVARPRTMRAWGTLPGAYVGTPHDPGGNQNAGSRRIPGGKPLWLMRALIRDYTRPGDTVCDPCAGGGTTLLAAAIEGRSAVGAEIDPETHAKAKARLAAGYTPSLPCMEAR